MRLVYMLRHAVCLAVVAVMATNANAQFTIREIQATSGTQEFNQHYEVYQYLTNKADFDWLEANGLEFEGSDNFDTINLGLGGGTFTGADTPLHGSANVNDWAADARAIVTIPAGTWSIAFGSDDGGQLTLQTQTGSPISFSSTFGQNRNFHQTLQQPPNQIYFNDNRGHGWTGGTFTVSQPTTAIFHASFHERGGGDSFEVAITEGQNTGVNATGWALLGNDVKGWKVAPTTNLPAMLGGSPKGPSGGSLGGQAGIQQAITPVAGVKFNTTGDGTTTSPGLNQLWVDSNNAGNLVGNLAGIANAANGRVNFVNKVVHWGGNDGVVGDIPKYPEEIVASAVFGAEAGGNIESYTVWSSGEIDLPAGQTKLRYAVDDYKYLAIDSNGNGVAGDQAGEVLLDDNTWVNRFGGRGNATQENQVVAVEVPAAGWYKIEAIMSEGGGGDSAVLYWDAGNKAAFPHVVQMDLNAAAIPAENFAVPASKFRSVARGALNATAPFTLSSSLKGTNVNLDVSSDLVDADHVVLQSTAAPSEISLDGAIINLSVSGGPLVAGDSFVLFVADRVGGGGTATWNYPAGTTAADWNVSELSDTDNKTNRIYYKKGTSTNPADCNGDGKVNGADLACACSKAGGVDAVLAATGLVKGDLDGNGSVAFADFLVMSANFGLNGDYTKGDIDCSGSVAFPDFLILSANFGLSGGGAAAAVPEPSSFALMGIGSLLVGLARRRRS